MEGNKSENNWADILKTSYDEITIIIWLGGP